MLCSARRGGRELCRLLPHAHPPPSVCDCSVSWEQRPVQFPGLTPPPLTSHTNPTAAGQRIPQGSATEAEKWKPSFQVDSLSRKLRMCESPSLGQGLFIQPLIYWSSKLGNHGGCINSLPQNRWLWSTQRDTHQVPPLCQEPWEALAFRSPFMSLPDAKADTHVHFSTHEAMNSVRGICTEVILPVCLQTQVHL